MALHMYYLVRCMWLFLSNRHGHKFFTVFEWVMKTEYQGRGTPHWHIAAWIVCHGLLAHLKGRTSTAIVSAFVKFVAALFHCEVDVQIGNGRLNYINGYVAKDHDAVDVGLGEYVRTNSTAPWLATFRLLSKSTPCIPEAAIRMAQLSEFDRSYSHVLLYPPQPRAMIAHEARLKNFSSRMYGSQAFSHGYPFLFSFVWTSPPSVAACDSLVPHRSVHEPPSLSRPPFALCLPSPLAFFLSWIHSSHLMVSTATRCASKTRCIFHSPSVF